MAEFPLLATLPFEQRLALAYAPAAARGVVGAVLALDSRLATIVRSGGEPVLAQLRLAWWRDQLALAPAARAAGEPLLALLAPLGTGLSALVDGWERLAVTDEVTDPDAEVFAAGRARAFAEAAAALGIEAAAGEAERAAQGWALADLAAKLGRADERSRVAAIAAGCDWRRADLPRPLRPLQVLHGLARRSRGSRPLLTGPADLLVAARLGLLGF